MKLIRTKKVLVPIDFSAISWKSFQVAASLGIKLNLKLNLMHVLPSGSLPILELIHQDKPEKKDITQYYDQFAQKLKTESQRLIEQCDFEGDGLDLETIISSGTPSRQILQEIYQTQPDLVVMGSHGLSEIMSVLLGGCAERVIQGSPKPVLVVPKNIDFSLFLGPRPETPGPKRKTKPGFKILLPTDFSEPSKHALHYAMELCQLLPASLYVVHVIEKYSFIDIGNVEPDLNEIKEKREQIISFLQDEMVFERCNLIKISVSQGDPVKEILSIGSIEKINLIVMGTLGRKWLERLLLGSTTEAVISRSRCPVLTVRGAKKTDKIEKKYHKISEKLTPYDLQTETIKVEKKESGDEGTFLLSKEDPSQPSHLFLGYYSPEGIKNAMDQYGISRLLQKRGYHKLTYYIDTRNPYHHIVRIFLGEEENYDQLMVEFALNVEVQPFNKLIPSVQEKTYLHFLVVDWVLLQNPLAEGFDTDRPRLPGQTKPGLGISYEIFGVLMMMAERLKKDGLLNRPEHYHNAYLYHERCRFVSPEKEGLFLAITRDTANFSLPEVSWAIDQGFLIDEFTEEPLSWTGEDLILPFNQTIVDYFKSESYTQDIRNTLTNHRFRMDWDNFAKVKDELMFPGNQAQ
ncbi:universal stress protein [candidate division CSSED10-310 bacterium]|uniref:Universal stress protein n=1 Tax=candidate division CSSED10-310 bacterium TaxID=2855610 RepID=A0ABV6Z3Y7_UNCC1